MMTSREKIGLALGVIGVCMFGGTLPATRLAITTFDPFFLSAARAVIAGLLGIVALVIARRSLPSPRMLGELAITGIFTIVCYPILLALALTTVPASHGGVVLGILPLATAAAGVFLVGERPSLGFWIAGLFGSALVLTFVFWRSGGIHIEQGDVYLLLAVVMGALAYAWSGRVSATMPGWEVISWQVAMYLPVTIGASLYWWPVGQFAPSASAWAGFAYVSTVSMFFSFFVFNAAMAIGGVARVGQLMLLQPFVIVALSVPVNGETLEPATVLFAAAVVATVLVGQRMRVGRTMQRRP